MKKEFELLPPMMPNFISINQSPQEGQDRFKIPVSDLSDQEAEAYGELMKRAFIAHHRERVRKSGEEVTDIPGSKFHVVSENGPYFGGNSPRFNPPAGTDKDGRVV